MASPKYTIVPLSILEAAYYDRQRGQNLCLCEDSTPGDVCLEPVRFEAAVLLYVSPAGQLHSISRRHICLKHARIFCERNELALPEPEV